MARRLKLQFIAVTCDEDFFRPVRKGMADAASLMDVEATFTGTKGVDAGEMAVLARQAMADGIDGLALVAFDGAAFAPLTLSLYFSAMTFSDPSARERALRLQGRIQALAEVSEQMVRLGESTSPWRALTDWLEDAEDEVLQEFEMVKAELTNDSR